IFATGSEINPAFKAARKFETEGYSVRLISVPSWELFDRQDDSYKNFILHCKANLKVSIEAGVGLGWQKFIGQTGLMISQETYGASAPEPVMADHFGFTAEKIYKTINDSLNNALKQIAV
ncbi:MAG: transketolase, partial [Ignavibacteria bacterium]|nr:transketolase [Ignavibacteria bacterium]